jgi:hypothetical protein
MSYIGPLLATALITCGTAAIAADTFKDDVDFLRRHVEVILLSDAQGNAKVALVPAWQGRVMTSTARGDDGPGFGWVNRELIASGKLEPHINVFGGEDRIWLGPEGGQFSIFFAKDAPFDLDHWFVPKPLDTLPFETVSHSGDRAHFRSDFDLTNHSGAAFSVRVDREIHLLTPEDAWRRLGERPAAGVELVAYESRNTLTNTGDAAWNRETGLLSLWVLGMFNSSPSTTIAVPIKAGPESELGAKVTSDYFGKVPAERLVVHDNAVFLLGDARYRSKIGINPRRSLGKLGSYDVENHVLTIVQFDQPADVTEYVNSLWELQSDPFGGDAINSYNDGPPSPGAKQLGQFYELETSSPAAMLSPNGSIGHTHRTIHLTGPEAALDAIARSTLGVSLSEFRGAFAN